MTNPISAKQKWAESYFLRTNISIVLDQLGIRKNNDSSHYIKRSKIKKDNEILHNVINVIKETVNPFSDIEKSQPCNIDTGKAASVETEMFLLHIQDNGDKARNKFINECVENPKQFEERICRQKLATFATSAVKKQLRQVKEKSLHAS